MAADSWSKTHFFSGAGGAAGVVTDGPASDVVMKFAALITVSLATLSSSGLFVVDEDPNNAPLLKPPPARPQFECSLVALKACS